jgi:hypothetical protein
LTPEVSPNCERLEKSGEKETSSESGEFAPKPEFAETALPVNPSPVFSNDSCQVPIQLIFVSAKKLWIRFKKYG